MTQTLALPFASQPFGIAFAPTGGVAFVVLEATGNLLKLDAHIGRDRSRRSTCRHESAARLRERGWHARVRIALHHAAAAGREHRGRAARRPPAAKCWSHAASHHDAARDRHASAQRQARLRDPGQRRPELPGRRGAFTGRHATPGCPSKQDNILRGTLRNGANLNFQNTVRAIASHIDRRERRGGPDRPRRSRQCQPGERGGVTTPSATICSSRSRPAARSRSSMRRATTRSSASASAARRRVSRCRKTASAST